ncbi:rRNA methyltransferase 3, mitochondrial-like [Glandiceps talaboti]
MSASMYMCVNRIAKASSTTYAKFFPNIYTIQCRNYGRRGLRRKPVRVITSDLDETNRVRSASRIGGTKPIVDNVGKEGQHVDQYQENKILYEKSQYVEVGTSEVTEPKLKYDKVGPDDKRVRRVLTMVKSRKYREQTKKVLLEGRRLITDAILAGGECQTIYFSRVENLEGVPWNETGADLLKIPFREVKLWSDVITPQGILAVFSMPTFEHFLYESQEGKIPLTVICDNIREPGNLGALLRSAVAAGCQKILVTKGCVDIWDLKVLRAGAGAHFRAPIIHNLHWQDVKSHLDDDTTVYLADCRNSEAEEMAALENEEQESRKTNFQNQMLRQPHKLLNMIARDELVDEDDHEDLGQKLAELPTTEFYNINWITDSAVVIGGETHGLSQQAVELSDTTGGSKIYIPMTRGMDSLNSAMAASIVVFEAKRQCLNSEQTTDV